MVSEKIWFRSIKPFKTMDNHTSSNITVRDIDIPFSRLVVVIFKVMLASIPALILFYGIMFIAIMIFFAVFGGAAAALDGLAQP